MDTEFEVESSLWYTQPRRQWVIQTLTLTPFSKKSIADRLSRGRWGDLTSINLFQNYFIHLLLSPFWFICRFGDLSAVSKSRLGNTIQLYRKIVGIDLNDLGCVFQVRATQKVKLLLLIGRRITSARRAKSDICSRLSHHWCLTVQCVKYEEMYGMKYNNKCMFFVRYCCVFIH